MALSPQYASVPKIGIAAISLADTSMTAPAATAVGTVITAPSAGTRINKIQVQATATNAAGVVRLWIHDGTNIRLFYEIETPATTVSTTSRGFNTSISELTNPDILPIVLPSGYSLRATTTIAQGFNVIAYSGDLT